MSERLNRVFARPALRASGKETMTVADWTPTVDISESDGEYLIKAELPEVKKEDVKVTVEDGVLTLQGERRQEKEEKGKRYHRVERSYGSFVRSFTLPESVDETGVKAEYKDGVLSLHLPKSEKVKPKAIDVKVA
jgi:HSP20 family protein